MKANLPIVLNSKDKQKLKREIVKQLKQEDVKHARDMDYMILYAVRQTFGCGKDRLKRFYKNFFLARNELLERYEMPDDIPWLCSRELKKLGIDLEEWEKEIKEDVEKFGEG